MTDELTIYISPEDDLTNVRERLERITTRRVTLVIPAQTQLRSHVAWKLLHARARELGKDVLIISSDPQIRSVAQAVKFRVAHSLESPPTGKSRTGGRPTRSDPGSKGGKIASAVQRTVLGRGSTNQQAPVVHILRNSWVNRPNGIQTNSNILRAGRLVLMRPLLAVSSILFHLPMIILIGSLDHLMTFALIPRLPFIHSRRR